MNHFLMITGWPRRVSMSTSTKETGEREGSRPRDRRYTRTRYRRCTNIEYDNGPPCRAGCVPSALATPMDTGIELEQLIDAIYLSSPALPIGAYSYSQGLEAAVDANVVHSETEVGEWILAGLREIVGPGEAATVAWQYRFWTDQNFAEMQQLNTWWLTSRETAELRHETEQMGWSLARIALSLNWADELSRQHLSSLAALAFPTAFAFAAVANGLAIGTTLAAFCFSWVENQVSAALRGVPLGQESGQRLLQQIRPEIPKVVEKAIGVGRDEIVTFAPMLGIFSSRHDIQAFRMFRS